MKIEQFQALYVKAYRELYILMTDGDEVVSSWLYVVKHESFVVSG